MASFLFEIGLEEVPARMIQSAEEELVRRTSALLKRERLLAEDGLAVGYSTPRRIAVRVWDVLERQDDLVEDLLGPAAKIAYKDGVAGPAAIAFAKKSGVTVEDLKIVSTPKGDYVSAVSTRAGRTAAEVLTAELPKELTSIYWAKNMYWRPGKPEKFVRPVRWLTALLDEAVVPVHFAGYEAGRLTYGHRVLYGPEPIVLGEPADYEIRLKNTGFVEPFVEHRRHTIRKALDHVCRTIPDTRWREDHVLVDKMTHLTEWPSVVAGDFDPAYLELPEEVLVTVMRDHQNYFAVESKDGKLAPHFLAVLNTEADEAGRATIRHGNARVLRARFNDARFFWEFDQRILLEDRVALLEHVTFQKDLGSYEKKSIRVAEACRVLARKLDEAGMRVDLEALETAARLAKTDLTCELVKEFTELQGEIGGLYARAQGAPKAAADAIYDQYRPTSMEDRIPRTVEGQVLAIADKVDTIAGLFAFGLEPTGSKDPFALRRAANGIVKILAESTLPLGLSEVIEASNAHADVAAKMSVFFRERLDFYLREAKSQPYDVVKAVLAAGADQVRNAVARAEAVTSVRGSADFLAVSAAFKRMKNILAQAAAAPAEEAPFEASSEPDVPAQVQLFTAADAIAKQVSGMRDDYPAALRLIATLRPEVDQFFDSVMVMDPDPAVRHKRLAVLRSIVRDFSTIADFSEIVTAG